VVIILTVRDRVVGVVVDGVSDVITLQSSQINTVPSMVSTIDTKYLVGLGTVEGRMLILVNIESLMTSQEMQVIESVTE
jgi:purine-binding chemotaxis protein CheW